MHDSEAESARLPQARPFDEFNRELVRNVRPPDWRNPQPRGRYNLVVVGGGTAGLVAAAGAAGLGAQVALVERELLGGDCLNVGCVPSKALLRCARAAAEVRRAGVYGVRVGADVSVDFGAVMERMRRLRAELSPNDSAARLRSLGVDVFLGDGRFVAGDAVEVDGCRLEFSRACIATGARAALPPIEGLRESGCLTNETLFSLTELPSRVAVIGGGPIGCEMSQALARFGASVCLLETAPALLGREDPEASALVARALREDGVDVRLGVHIRSVASSPRGKLLAVEEKGEAHEIAADEILVAAGRAPNVAALGLEAAGVEYDVHRGVHVDAHLRTANPRIYAAGDVCLPFKFTHTADACARLVLRNALFFGRRSIRGLAVPWCTYTEPEVAHVEVYESESRRDEVGTQTVRIDLRDVDRARIDGAEAGFLKITVARSGD
jgi:pyruvate/2-oxoglutarate dehydrogenase complex dihydrolipoamide dehydrogenase (E3) component